MYIEHSTLQLLDVLLYLMQFVVDLLTCGAHFCLELFELDTLCSLKHHFFDGLYGIEPALLNHQVCLGLCCLLHHFTVSGVESVVLLVTLVAQWLQHLTLELL